MPFYIFKKREHPAAESTLTKALEKHAGSLNFAFHPIRAADQLAVINAIRAFRAAPAKEAALGALIKATHDHPLYALSSQTQKLLDEAIHLEGMQNAYMQKQLAPGNKEYHKMSQDELALYEKTLVKIAALDAHTERILGKQRLSASESDQETLDELRDKQGALYIVKDYLKNPNGETHGMTNDRQQWVKPCKDALQSIDSLYPEYDIATLRSETKKIVDAAKKIEKFGPREALKERMQSAAREFIGKRFGGGH